LNPPPLLALSAYFPIPIGRTISKEGKVFLSRKAEREKSTRRRSGLWPESKWEYLILISLPGLAIFWLFILPLITGPTLSRSQMEWKEFLGDDPKGYPLEVIRHGYRMIRAYRAEPQKKDGRQERGANLVEWEWYAEVKNKSNRDLEFYLNYSLVDKDHLLVDVDYLILKREAPAWETVTIEHKTEMPYEDLARVSTGVWEISWGEGKISHKNRRKGY